MINSYTNFFTLSLAYHDLLAPLESSGILRRPIIPDVCQHNAHMYAVLLAPQIDRQKVLDDFNRRSIRTGLHYVPLHSSPAGLCYTRTHGSLHITEDSAQRLLRLPLWFGISQQEQDNVVAILKGLTDD